MLRRSLVIGWLGEAYASVGRIDDAAECAGKALDFARDQKERGHEADALRLLGDIAVCRGGAGDRSGGRPLRTGHDHRQRSWKCVRCWRVVTSAWAGCMCGRGTASALESTSTSLGIPACHAHAVFGSTKRWWKGPGCEDRRCARRVSDAGRADVRASMCIPWRHRLNDPAHKDLILDQFTRQAAPFSTARTIADESALQLLVQFSAAGAGRHGRWTSPAAAVWLCARSPGVCGTPPAST